MTTQTKGRERKDRVRGSAPWFARHLSTFFVSPATAVLLSVGWLALPIGGGSMAALAGPAEQVILAAKGQEMVFPIDERVLAPPIRLLTASYADGSVFDLAEERGNIVVLFFMAAWCPTCIPEAHALAKLHEDYADRGVRIIALDVDQNETEAELARFRDRIGNSQHLWAMDTGFQVVRALSVRALDATVVIDREGRVAYKDAYPTRYQTLAAVVEALLL